MLSLNLFVQKAKSYRRLSISTEEEDDTCISPGVSAPREEHDAHEDLLLAKRLRRPWHWSCMHVCGYLFVALLSFLIGLGLSPNHPPKITSDTAMNIRPLQCSSRTRS